MPDIGLGEVVVIAVLALLVFGPDRLPKVAADAGRMLRQIRDLASSARKDLMDAADLQDDGDLRSVVNELDPRKGLRDEPPRPSASAPEPKPPGASTPTAPAAAHPSVVDDWT